MRIALSCVLACVLAVPALAGDAPPVAPANTPPTPVQAAGQAALDAFTAKDDAGFASLAARDDPDPWLVAEDLLRRGAADAAEAFAKAKPRADVEALPAYVASRRGVTEDAARRARVAAALSALSAGRLDAALDALGPAETPVPRDVMGVQLAQLRGIALARQQKLADAAKAMGAAADAAEAMGWLARTAMCVDALARIEFDAREFDRAAAALERQRAVATRRGDRAGVAMAWSGLLAAAEARGDAAKAAEAAAQALAAWEATGDAANVANSRALLGRCLLRTGDVARGVAALDEAAAALRALGDRPGLAQALMDLGDVAAQAGDGDRAARTWEEAQAIFEAVGDRGSELGVLLALGRLRSQGAQRDDAKAIALLTRALRTATDLGAPDAEAEALVGLGNVHALRADRAAARDAFERAIAVRERLGDERALAAMLIDAGRRFVRGLMRDETVAKPWLERGLTLAEKAGERRWVVNALMHGADLELESDRPAEAITRYERALAAAQAAGLAEAEAAARLGIGNAHLKRRDGPAALAAYEPALAAFERLGNRAGMAGVLEQMARAHALRPSHAQAVAAYQRAIETIKPTGDVLLMAGLLRGLGRVQLGVGDAQKALAALEHALKLYDSRDDRVGASETLLVLGVAYRQLGRFALSLDATERARSLQLAVGDRNGAAMTLCNLGVVYWDLGHIEKALGMYERALVDLEAVNDRDSIATTLGNLGATHERLGDPAHALEFHTRALAIWEELKDRGGVGRARIAMGMCHLALGAMDEALAVTERGIADLEASGDKRLMAWGQVILGTVLEKRGAGAKAVAAFERAARGAEKLGATSLQVEALGGLAAARLRAGDAGRALSEAHRAVELMKTLVGGLGEEKGASARGEFTDLFATGLRAAAQVGDVAEAAFFLESGRAGALLEALEVRDAQRWADVPEELRQAEAEARADEARALAAWTKASDGDDRALLRGLRADLDAARAKVAQAVERIQREAKKASRLAYPVATPVEDIQAALADGEALVLYGLAKGDDPAHALVLTRDAARIVELGPTSAAVAACEALHVDDPSTDATAALDRLRALLVTKLALGDGVRRVLVSPDGVLGYVPFAALVGDLELAYVASGSTYGFLREERADRGTQVLALGDPDYQVKFDPTALDLYAPQRHGGAVPATRGGRLTPLPGTRAEATAIGDVTLLGKDASEGRLVEEVVRKAGRWRAVHFACHGLVDPDRPSLSSLALTPDAANDGFLTVSEVLRMDLRADLAVLSACETGRGKVVSGEGIVGLTRAFMFAGAPSVLCSLWKVDDAATAALMKRFYELWNPKDGSPGKSPAAALREAQAFVRAQPRWKHPYYWAAWVLWGLPT